jgi:hypothetical protein
MEIFEDLLQRTLRVFGAGHPNWTGLQGWLEYARKRLELLPLAAPAAAKSDDQVDEAAVEQALARLQVRLKEDAAASPHGRQAPSADG